MFVIRLQHGHYTGPALPKTLKFDHPSAMDDLARKRDVEDAERHNRTTDAFTDGPAVFTRQPFKNFRNQMLRW